MSDVSQSLKGRVVFVTGSARRVGRAIALEFARHGASLVIHHASSSSAEDARSAAEAVREIGGDAIVVSGNQGKSDDLANIFKQIREHYGRLDIMVNSAAIFKRTPLLDITEEEWDLVMDINLKGPFMLTQQASRLMIESGANEHENGGLIINISDNSGLNAWESRPHHSISKAGVIMLTQVSSLSLAPHNIRVNCIIPGPVLRPAGEDESVMDSIIEALPIGRIGTPNHIADACIFFAKNNFATGSILKVDGGEGLAGGET